MPPSSPFSLADFVAELAEPGALIGIGVDIAPVDQVARAARGRGFVRQVFSPDEGQAFAIDSWQPAALARAFALKEAFFKALGTGQRLDMLFHEIAAPPFAPVGALALSGRTREVASALGVQCILAGSTLESGIALGWVLLTG